MSMILCAFCQICRIPTYTQCLDWNENISQHILILADFLHENTLNWACLSHPKLYVICERSHVLPFTPSLKSFGYSGSGRKGHKLNVHLCTVLSKTTLKLCDIGDLHTGFLSKVWNVEVQVHSCLFS